MYPYQNSEGYHYCNSLTKLNQETAYKVGSYHWCDGRLRYAVRPAFDDCHPETIEALASSYKQVYEWRGVVKIRENYRICRGVQYINAENQVAELIAPLHQHQTVDGRVQAGPT
jgi:hypothetical protein